METITGSQEELERKAAEKISEKIPKIMESKEKSSVNIGIAGGRSVKGVFKALTKQRIDWSKVHLFIVDECLDGSNANFKVAKEGFVDELVSRGLLPEGNVHPFVFKEDKPDKGILKYSAMFQEYGTTYDIVILSSGEDGHVGSLFPYHPSINDLSPFFIHVAGSPKPPSERMSASKNLLSQSSVGILLFFGEEKRYAYESFCDSSVDVLSCPAKILENMPEGYVYRSDV